jgi:hypothetical protein
MKRECIDEDAALGAWLSAALDDPKVCKEMKNDIENWFDSFEYKSYKEAVEKLPLCPESNKGE